jgi:hypothetical protein
LERSDARVAAGDFEGHGAGGEGLLEFADSGTKVSIRGSRGGGSITIVTLVLCPLA